MTFFLFKRGICISKSLHTSRDTLVYAALKQGIMNVIAFFFFMPVKRARRLIFCHSFTLKNELITWNKKIAIKTFQMFLIGKYR